MRLSMYSVYDRKSCVYHPPVYCHNDAHAMRYFQSDLFKDPQSLPARYSQDFRIYCVGQYDDGTGAVIPEKEPRLLTEVTALKEQDHE